MGNVASSSSDPSRDPIATVNFTVSHAECSSGEQFTLREAVWSVSGATLPNTTSSFWAYPAFATTSFPNNVTYQTLYVDCTTATCPVYRSLLRENVTQASVAAAVRAADTTCANVTFLGVEAPVPEPTLSGSWFKDLFGTEGDACVSGLASSVVMMGMLSNPTCAACHDLYGVCPSILDDAFQRQTMPLTACRSSSLGGCEFQGAWKFPLLMTAVGLIVIVAVAVALVWIFRRRARRLAAGRALAVLAEDDGVIDAADDDGAVVVARSDVGVYARLRV